MINRISRWAITIVSLILLGLLFRLIIIPFAFHVDIFSNAGWGEWIFKYGTGNFYQNNVWTYSWPTQPPLVNLLYGLDFWLFLRLVDIFSWLGTFVALHHLGAGHVLWYYQFANWFTAHLYQDTPFAIGFLMTIKLLAIAADLTIAVMIYQVFKSQSGRTALLFSAIFLFFPFSWYISALWGQYDSVSFVMLLAAFLLLFKRQNLLATIFIIISFFVKPTSLIFSPVFLFLYLQNRPRLQSLIGSIIVISTLTALVSLPFSHNLPHFLLYDMPGKIFLKAEFKLTNNAFNFWEIVAGAKPADQNTPFILIQARLWGYAAYVVLNVLAYRFVGTRSLKNWFIALFIIGAGSFLFMTNMLDRYYYAGIVFGLLACFSYKKLLPYWILLSLIFSVNLFHQWWVPSALWRLKVLLLWQAGFVPRLLSGMNVLVFILMVYQLLRYHFSEKSPE